MPKFNDFDLVWENWKELTGIWTDSLWIINERDKSGKHSKSKYYVNFLHNICFFKIMLYYLGVNY